MKQVYNLAGLMRKLKVDSFSELQEHGYDVRSYLELREQELADELEAIRQGLQELDSRDEELARARTQNELNDEFDTPFSSASANPSNVMSPYPQRISSNGTENVAPYGSAPAYPVWPPYPQPDASSNGADEDTHFSSSLSSNNDDDEDDEDTPFSSPRTSRRKYESYNDDDTDLPSNFGFDSMRVYSDPDYVYIGT